MTGIGDHKTLMGRCAEALVTRWMIRCCFRFTVAIIFCAAITQPLENRVAGEDVTTTGGDSADVQDILFCGTRRPFLIRLHLYVRGEGFRELRHKWAEEQFVQFDADRNGFLEGDELKRLPSPVSLPSGRTLQSPRILNADSDLIDGKVSLSEFCRYLITATGTPFSIVSQQNNVQINLFPKLDANQDGKLSAEEIAGAAARLRLYDQNEDDVITAAELQGRAINQPADDANLSSVFGFLVVVDPSNTALVSRRLLESYDKASRDPVAKVFRKDERLSKTELLIESENFNRADHNHDGKLDRPELGQLSAAMNPSVELTIEAPSTSGEFIVKSLRTTDPANAAVIALKQSGDGRQLLVLNEVAFALSAAGSPDSIEQQLRMTYLSQFKNLDQDKNDYLDTLEMQRFGFVESFILQADADGDGKLFEKEYAAQIDRELALSKTGLVLEVGGDGRSLFRLIDTNPTDNRLTLRELSDAATRLSKWDSNGDGAITLTELSIALNGVFRAGVPRINGPFAPGRFVANMANPPGRQTDARTDVPSWFVKMDRNNDGDLSPKEFLGRRALFDTIDTNRDGLISADEAKAAPVK